MMSRIMMMMTMKRVMTWIRMMMTIINMITSKNGDIDETYDKYEE